MLIGRFFATVDFVLTISPSQDHDYYAPPHLNHHAEPRNDVAGVPPEHRDDALLLSCNANVFLLPSPSKRRAVPGRFHRLREVPRVRS